MTRLCLVLLAVSASTLPAQVPAAVSLWKVMDETVAQPSALVTGPLAPFWNAAGLTDAPGIDLGVEVLQTPAPLGMSAVVAGASTTLVPRVRLGGMLGKVEMQDLVRTTTSPQPRPGSIPVYDQFAGAAAVLDMGPLETAINVVVHDARFDRERRSAVTTDLGVAARASSHLRLAGATRYTPTLFESDDATEFVIGAEYAFGTILVRDLPVAVAAQYGMTVKSRGRGNDAEHTASAQAQLNGVVDVRAALTRETAYGRFHWRPAVQVGLLIGRYRLAIARAEGLNELGSTYRVSFGARVLD